MEKEKNSMTKFNVEAKNQIEKSLTESKDVIIQTQKGKAIITSIKTSLLEADFISDKIKVLIKKDGYSDFAIGLALEIIANTFTDSTIIRKAAQEAALEGTIRFSDKFDFIEN